MRVDVPDIIFLRFMFPDAFRAGLLLVNEEIFSIGGGKILARSQTAHDQIDFFGRFAAAGSGRRCPVKFKDSAHYDTSTTG